MKYYTEFLPVDLAEKLKEKGMPVEIDCDTFDSGTEYQREERWCNNTYAEIFDYFLNEEIYVRIIPFGASRIGEKTWDWTYYIDQLGEPYTETDYYWHTWHEAANVAIEKALELI